MKKIFSRYLKRDENPLEIALNEIESHRNSPHPSIDELKRKAPDLPPWKIEIIHEAFPYTMTGLDRLSVLIDAVEYIESKHIDGSIVECGVWKGGSMLAAVRTLQQLGRKRNIWLYDTFSGMPEPTIADMTHYGASASQIRENVQSRDGSVDWCRANLECVTELLRSSQYDIQDIFFVPGKVEDTIPESVPDKIAILRLDTDFYESTAHELNHLYKLVSPGGIVIFDDYGYWSGSRKAVDEFLDQCSDPLFLIRVDTSCRLAVKPYP